MNIILLVFFYSTMADPTVPATSKRTQVCYDHIVCLKTEPPWTGATRPLPTPRSPEKVKLEFYLVTRNTADKSINEWKLITTDFYKPDSNNLDNLDYQTSRKRTAIHVHGMYHTNAWNWAIQKRMAMAYLFREDVNVIFVKYNAKIWNFYLRLVADIRTVGAIAAKYEFLTQLMEMTSLRADQIHIIGFSLGAHVAGYIGKIIPNIYRITGLEPAKPFFEHAAPMYRLCDTDAQHVDVLHTNTAVFIPFGGLGYKPPLGAVDFYFNGGNFQRGCILDLRRLIQKYYMKFKIKQSIVNTYLILGCSHLRSIDYWEESLLNFQCRMWGVERKSRLDETTNTQAPTMTNQRNSSDHSRRDKKCVPVGLGTFDYVESGKFYVPTRIKSPYCIPENPPYCTAKNNFNDSVTSLQ